MIVVIKFFMLMVSDRSIYFCGHSGLQVSSRNGRYISNWLVDSFQRTSERHWRTKCSTGNSSQHWRWAILTIGLLIDLFRTYVGQWTGSSKFKSMNCSSVCSFFSLFPPPKNKLCYGRFTQRYGTGQTVPSASFRSIYHRCLRTGIPSESDTQLVYSTTQNHLRSIKGN